MKSFTHVLVLSFALGFGSQAKAVAIEDFVFELEVGGELVLDGLTGLPVTGSSNPGNDTFSYQLAGDVIGDEFRLGAWSATFDVDPFLASEFSLVNTSGGPQTFALTMAIPVPAFPYDRVLSSFVDLVAFDSNDDFVLSLTSPAFFVGLVDGSEILSLLDPLSLTRDDCTNPFGSRCGAPAEEGLARQLVTPDVADQVGIRIAFTLSPQDSVTVATRFQVAPEPTTALLLGGGLAVLSLARRRPERAG